MKSHNTAATPQGPPLRLCGYCQTWNNKPCGNQCHWSPSDPVYTPDVAQTTAATLQPSIDAVARLSRELLIELDTYWSGISGPSLSGIMLDWRNKYRILLEDGGATQGSGSRAEIRNAALEEAALYHDTEAANCRAIASCNRDNDLGVDSETHAIDHEIAAKDIRELKTSED